jgi:molybdenum cofactor cytidylyltransferase
MANLEGVILAGGISSRMGFPKALMPIGDSFFLLKVYQTLVDAGVTPVHVVVNSGLRSSLDAQMAKFPEAEFVPNNEPAKGQIYSLQLGLRSAQSEDADAAVVALVDQPYIRPETVVRLVQAAAAAPDKIIVPSHDGQHGHPFVIPAALFEAFINATGATARDIIHQHQSSVQELAVDDPGTLADVDSPEDLLKL